MRCQCLPCCANAASCVWIRSLKGFSGWRITGYASRPICHNVPLYFFNRFIGTRAVCISPGRFQVNLTVMATPRDPCVLESRFTAPGGQGDVSAAQCFHRHGWVVCFEPRGTQNAALVFPASCDQKGCDGRPVCHTVPLSLPRRLIGTDVVSVLSGRFKFHPAVTTGGKNILSLHSRLIG